jgi:hypothetical protein
MLKRSTHLEMARLLREAKILMQSIKEGQEGLPRGICALTYKIAKERGEYSRACSKEIRRWISDQTEGVGYIYQWLEQEGITNISQADLLDYRMRWVDHLVKILEAPCEETS